jgi:hypothetical protein
MSHSPLLVRSLKAPAIGQNGVAAEQAERGGKAME